MTKTVFTYSFFTIAFILVSLTFVTAVSFTQLAVAIIIYPLLAFFAYKAFPHFWGHYSKKPDNPHSSTTKEQAQEIKTQAQEIKTQEMIKAETTITDIDKRAFLKLIGATGLSFFLISVFARRVEALFFGQNIRETPTYNVKTNVLTNSPTDGYKISGVDSDADGYFGYIKKDGSWYIMKRDLNTGLFLYVKGDSKFSDNWENREKLRYDYFNNVFK